jgi:hypothetical protein
MGIRGGLSALPGIRSFEFHALVSQRRERRFRDRRAVIDRDAHEHVAGGLRIETDMHDFAHVDAAIAHRRLGLQPRDRLGGGNFVGVAYRGVAREPERHCNQHGADHQHERPGSQRMSLVLHGSLL